MRPAWDAIVCIGRTSSELSVLLQLPLFCTKVRLSFKAATYISLVSVKAPGRGGSPRESNG